MKQQVYKLIEHHYRDNFAMLVKRYNRYLQHIHNAEDIIQEAYCRAFKYWSVFPEDGNLDKWINSIIINCSRDHYKQEILKGMGDGNDGQDVLIDAAAFPAMAIDEITKRIWDKGDVSGYILYLSIIEGWRPREIVEAGKADTEAAVRQLVYRFRKEIVEDFKPEV